MATSSFTKEIIIDNPESVALFEKVISENQTAQSIDRNLASDETMERGKQLLKLCLSR